MKVIIVGGVAAGASAAARLRRLDESAEIILLEKGNFISYANCGLPYHLGGVIADREDLLVMSPEKFSSWFRVDVRPRNEAIAIDREQKKLRISGPEGEYEESYDKLLLATGAMPSENRQSKRIHSLWTLGDMDRIKEGLTNAKRVIISGAGFIGLEVAENLRHAGMDVTILQRSSHVMPTLDPEMAQPLAAELNRAGIKIRFGCTAKEYNEEQNHVSVLLDCGDTIETDFVITATGVVPNTKLAQDCGLACGPKGHIITDETLRTSDPDIYAAGDAAEVLDPIFGGKTAIPLAGPANKQGRIAADNMAGKHSVYKGSFGTSVVKLGNLTAAAVGLTEEKLKQGGHSFRKLYLHPNSNASYYPGGTRMTLKLLFGDDGTIYGAQIVGMKGVDKRIDSIAQAMRNGLKAPELGELELAYAPPYSSAKDPVNFAGFVAENILNGLSDPVYPDSIPADALILDVREPEEHDLGAIPGAVNIRLGDLRDRLNELDRSKKIVTCCQVGLRGYLAERILKQNGFQTSNLSGGWLTWKMFHPDPSPQITNRDPEPIKNPEPEETMDVRSLPCPGPVIKLKEKMKSIPDGSAIRLLAASTFESDLLTWARGANCEVLSLTHQEGYLESILRKGSGSVRKKNENSEKNGVSIVLFSNDYDKAMAAMILSNAFAAAGQKVNLFFTFWGLSILRKDPAPHVKKNLISRMFGWMLPRGAEKLALSKMNMAGLGTSMMKSVMKQKHVLSLPELIQSARAGGVRFIACDMAMDVMGITREELIEVDDVAGAATFVGLAAESDHTIFI